MYKFYWDDTRPKPLRWSYAEEVCAYILATEHSYSAFFMHFRLPLSNEVFSAHVEGDQVALAPVLALCE